MMAQRLTLLPERIVELRDLVVRLEGAPHSGRTSLVKRQANLYGVTVQTLYRWLKHVGWQSGRKRREDLGATSLSNENLETGAALQRTAIRKNGKLNRPGTVALSILKAQDDNIKIGPAQFRRLLKARQMDARTQARNTPHTQLQSLHPNHVHQVDPSLCVLYYMRGSQHMMEADQFYKNKLDNYAKVILKVWRYVLTDHASSHIVPWYVEAAGESAQNLFEFLLFAWGKKDGRPFHGVPKMLLWDKGSANTSGTIKSFLNALEVKHETHAPGNARAKGQVEGANNIVETQFESRLKAQPVNSVDELNESARHWANAYNANLIPGQCTLLTRNHIKVGARTDLWMTITADQLRILPSTAECRALLVGKAVERVVRGDLTVSYRHPQADGPASYDLTDFRLASVGDKVSIAPLVYGACAIVATLVLANGEVVEHRVEPITNINAFGFREDAPVIGEAYHAQPETPVQTQGKHLDQVAFGDLDAEAMKKAKAKNATPFAGQVDTHGYLANIEHPTYMPRQGEVIDTGRSFAAEKLNHIAAAKELRRVLASTYLPYHLQYLKSHYAQGITEEELTALITQFQTTTTSQIEAL